MRLCVSDYYEFYVDVSDSVLLISEKSYFFWGGGGGWEGEGRGGCQISPKNSGSRYSLNMKCFLSNGHD